MLRNGRWQMMAEPINYDRPVAGVGPAGSFAAMWCMEHEEDKIGLIPCAEGGSSLDDWNVDQTLYQHAVSQTRFALQDTELSGILWHQGENDSFGGSYQTYYEKLQVIVERLRNDLNAEKVPFIMGGLGDYLGKSGFGSNCAEYEMVNRELLRFAMEQEYTYFATAEGLTPNPDGIHIDAVSQRRFGIRYYEAFSKPESVNHLGEIFSENLKILCLWRYVFLQCFHPIVKKYLESYNPKTLAVIRFLAHFHLLGSRIQVKRNMCSALWKMK